MKFDSLFRWIPGQKKRRILLLHNPESRFTEIFSTNYWGSAESKSGFGSSLKATTQIRRELPEIFQKYQIRNVFDAPCGDFHWMQHVVRETSINYIGGDIVEPLINENTERFGSLNINFYKFDITMDRFPKADLWLCRHCLFHLSYADIAAALKRFLASDIPLIATTSHLFKDQKIVNSDIATGDFRMIDLFS